MGNNYIPMPSYTELISFTEAEYQLQARQPTLDHEMFPPHGARQVVLPQQYQQAFTIP
jgi:hypothetical protein